MKFIHAADLHINALRRFPGYLRRMERTLNQITNLAEKERARFIVVSGDIFDRLDVYHDERNVLSKWLSSTKTPIVMISGNHDTRSSEIGDTVISYLSYLDINKHIIYDGEPIVKWAFGAQFVLVPYHGWKHQDIYPVLEDLIASLDTEAGPIIVIMHEAVTGAYDGNRKIVRRNQVSIEGIDKVNYWALGDIHHTHFVLPNAWYPGPPHQTRFAEPEECGVLLVNTDDPTNPKFIKLDSIPLVILDELPDEWPPEDEAFVSLRVVPETMARIPSNVELSESIHKEAAQSLLMGREKRDNIGVFDGLEERLITSGLSEDLIPQAKEMAKQMAEEIGIVLE